MTVGLEPSQLLYVQFEESCLVLSLPTGTEDAEIMNRIGALDCELYAVCKLSEVAWFHLTANPTNLCR